MSTALATKTNGHPPASSGELMESVIIKGDLSRLTPEERGRYYMTVCKSVGLNPLTKPFEYITLNGKLTLYALRNCTDQLRTIHGVSVEELTESEREGVFIVTAKVRNSDGRTDIAKGAVNIAKLQGEALANAMMKAETKAKRRATLSICGLGFLDETEIEDIPAQVKTLPKKDAREVYTKLQAEIDAIKSYDALQKWGEQAKDRIAVLPADWQDILRARYAELLVDLRMHGEKPQDDGLNIPPSLRRTKAAPDADEIEQYDGRKLLIWIDEQLSLVTHPDMLETTWDYKIEPQIAKLSSDDQSEAMGLYRKHEKRLDQ